jgi:hypothetical protein
MDGIQAYERGVALILALPHPSPADTKLKDEYRAIAKLERKKRENVSDQRASGNSPWEIAEEMKPALQVHGRDGSQSCVRISQSWLSVSPPIILLLLGLGYRRRS